MYAFAPHAIQHTITPKSIRHVHDERKHDIDIDGSEVSSAHTVFHPGFQKKVKSQSNQKLSSRHVFDRLGFKARALQGASHP